MDPEFLLNWKYSNNSLDPDVSHVTYNNNGINVGQHTGQLFPLDDVSVTDIPVMTSNEFITGSKFTYVDVMWSVLFTSMLSTAILGNITVIWIISCHRRMRTVTNYFLLNLSIADLTMAALNGAPNFLYMLRNDWIFGKFLCVINNFVANWTVASCVFTMTAISIDRWMAIIKPLEPRMTKTTAWLAIGGIWIGSGLIAGPALLYSSTIVDNSRTYCIIVWPDGIKSPTDSKFELGYNICLFILTYFIPMIAMAVCYGWMSWELWGQKQIGEVTERQINSMISKRKVVRMFSVVVITFAICWLPYHGYFIYMHLDKNIVYLEWIQHLYLSFYFLAMSQSSINPIIVVSMNSRFRSYICDLVYNGCCRHEENTPDTRVVNYVVATPPLVRHNYSQSGSHSHSRSGTGEDNVIPGKMYRHHSISRSQTNGTRKKNLYISNGHEMTNLAVNNSQTQEPIANTRTPSTTLISRATYC